MKKDHILVVTASAVITALAGKIPPSKCRTAKKTLEGGEKLVGAAAVVAFVGTDPAATKVVCAAIEAALTGGAPDEWGQPGSAFRRALVAELDKLASQPSSLPNGGAISAPPATTPAPAATAADTIKLWVAAAARQYKFTPGSGDFSLHDKNLGPLADKAVRHFAGRTPTRSEVFDWVTSEAGKVSEWEDYKKAAFNAARTRNYKIAKGDLGNGFISSPTFSAVVNLAQYAPELTTARANGVDAAMAAAFDAFGIDQRDDPPATATTTEEEEAEIAKL